ncbi:lasso peptide biosynthesis B2 protein [Saccharothrix violaceirubra]|uniref:Microcin J25-processing protein McjB C-terminal domain-containing protein n=1 Tax=Saccharothrix violaceirubra TaxID=413306 RepID=A0A7W7WW58_9PSEU|nr:lasso peptide biosynthesis B2 protein [Saccharothrix violaceirubra]MBB4965627.1 hypothetical protein [Saccharothrix violaceirubra]
MTALRLPGHVHAAATARGGGVLLDRNSGRCYALNATAFALLSEWDRSGDFAAGLRRVAARDPAYRGERFARDSRTLADRLVAAGLLTSSPVPEAPVPEAAFEPSDAGESGRFAAVAVLVASVLVRLPFRVTAAVLEFSRRHWCRAGATREQVLAVILSADAGTRLHPGRVACLELSLGAVLALALRRRYAALVIGAAGDPCRFHAWVRAQDGPLNYPPETDLDDFRPVFTV